MPKNFHTLLSKREITGDDRELKAMEEELRVRFDHYGKVSIPDSENYDILAVNDRHILFLLHDSYYTRLFAVYSFQTRAILWQYECQYNQDNIDWSGDGDFARYFLCPDGGFIEVYRVLDPADAVKCNLIRNGSLVSVFEVTGINRIWASDGWKIITTRSAIAILNDNMARQGLISIRLLDYTGHSLFSASFERQGFFLDFVGIHPARYCYKQDILETGNGQIILYSHQSEADGSVAFKIIDTNQLTISSFNLRVDGPIYLFVGNASANEIFVGGVYLSQSYQKNFLAAAELGSDSEDAFDIENSEFMATVFSLTKPEKSKVYTLPKGITAIHKVIGSREHIVVISSVVSDDKLRIYCINRAQEKILELATIAIYGNGYDTLKDHCSDIDVQIYPSTLTLSFPEKSSPQATVPDTCKKNSYDLANGELLISRSNSAWFGQGVLLKKGIFMTRRPQDSGTIAYDDYRPFHCND